MAFSSVTGPGVPSAAVHGEALNQKVADALGKAIRHAERVCKRDHIKADRIERVNQFMTSLRRELTGTVEGMSGYLCRKEIWHDLGVLAPYFNVNGMPYTRSQIESWLNLAHKLRNGVEAARYTIEGDLEELERSFATIESIVTDARRINEESEMVVGQLAELMKPVSQ